MSVPCAGYVVQITDVNSSGGSETGNEGSFPKHRSPRNPKTDRVDVIVVVVMVVVAVAAAVVLTAAAAVALRKIRHTNVK